MVGLVEEKSREREVLGRLFGDLITEMRGPGCLREYWDSCWVL